MQPTMFVINPIETKITHCDPMSFFPVFGFWRFVGERQVENVGLFHPLLAIVVSISSHPRTNAAET